MLALSLVLWGQEASVSSLHGLPGTAPGLPASIAVLPAHSLGFFLLLRVFYHLKSFYPPSNLLTPSSFPDTSCFPCQALVPLGLYCPHSPLLTAVSFLLSPALFNQDLTGLYV